MMSTMMKPSYRLLPWVAEHFDKLNWSALSSNPYAISLLASHPEKIDWKRLSSNPNAMELLLANVDKINLCEFSKNPNAVGYLKNHPDMIDWHSLSKNENAIDLILANPDKVDTYQLCLNPHPLAIEILRKRRKRNKNCINWANLCTNPSAMNFIFDCRSNINWASFSANPAGIYYLKDMAAMNSSYLSKPHFSRNPLAIPTLTMYPHLIDWRNLSSNPAAIDLLRENQDNIDYTMLSANPSIFELDFEQMRVKFQPFADEIIALALCPPRVARYRELGFGCEDW